MFLTGWHGITGLGISCLAIAGGSLLGLFLVDGVGSLPAGEECVTGVGEQQEHTVSWLELPWPGRVVVGSPLFSLGCLHVLIHNGDHPPYLLLHYLVQT